MDHITWSPQVIFAHDTSIVDRDPNTGAALRTGVGPVIGGALPSVAIDPHTGEQFTDHQIAAPFDELSAPNAGGFFAGDREGLAVARAGERRPSSRT